MSAEWFYNRGGQSHGPVSGQELQQLSAAGQLSANDLIWREGMVEWIPARSLGLVGAPPPPARTDMRSRKPDEFSLPSAPRARARSGSNWGWIALFVVLMCASVAAGWLARSITWPPHNVNAKADAFRDKQPVRAAKSKNDRTAEKQIAAEVAQTFQETARPEVHVESSEAITGPPTEGSPPALRFKENSSAVNPKPEVPVSSASTDPAGASTAVPQQPQTLFQEIEVHRRPVISVQGIPLAQELRYRVHSGLLLQSSENGEVSVRQEIIRATLEEADDLSRASYANLIEDLNGAVFTFTLGRSGEVEDIKGYKDSRATSPIKRGEGTGFLLTSLLDEDGWKELMRLTFFRPTPEHQSGGSWQEQMTHDWGALGKWSGLTTFTKKSLGDNNSPRFDYTYAMTYSPPAAPSADLGFRIVTANFEPVEAGGTILFDAELNRIREVQERFHVRGIINTEVLGQPAEIQMEEQQLLTIRLSDQTPQ